MINKLKQLLDAAKADVSYEILDYVPELLAICDEAQRIDNRREENGERPTHLTGMLKRLQEKL